MTQGDAYKKAGVDIEAAQEAMERIKSHVRSTFTQDTVSDIGLFGGLTSLRRVKEYKDPVLVQSTDGVGTKLMIAEMMGKHDTVGQCLVNHCVNDILTQGAEPLTFLNYVASGKLKPEILEETIKGMAMACREMNCAMVGGETAEMPGVYRKGRHDLVGCITGVVEKDRVIDGSKIEEGDVLIGLPSSGLHTNGYSLVRKAFKLSQFYSSIRRTLKKIRLHSLTRKAFKTIGLELDEYVEELGCTLGEELLKIHKCYFSQVYPLIQQFDIHGIAHITGGGLIDNIARLLPDGLSARIGYECPVPPIFQMIQEIEKVSRSEMRRVFNLGIGMVLIVPFEQVKAIRGALGRDHWVLGAIWQRKDEGEEKVSFQ